MAQRGGCMRFLTRVRRDTPAEEVRELLADALADDAATALALVAHLRDPRGGLGERARALDAMAHLAEHHPRTFRANLKTVCVSNGCYRDLCSLHAASVGGGEPARLMAAAVLEGSPLACKWAPSERSHFDREENGRMAREIMRILSWSGSRYRRELKKGRDGLVEGLLCEGRWDEIAFGDVPGAAMRRYARRALPEHCGERFRRWQALQPGPLLAPHRIVSRWLDLRGCPASAWAVWRDHARRLGGLSRVIPVADTSDDMRLARVAGLPAVDAAVAQALLCTECGYPLHMTLEASPSVRFLPPDPAARARAVRAAASSGSSTRDALLLALLRHAVVTNMPAAVFPLCILVITRRDPAAADYGPLNEDTRSWYSFHGFQPPAVVVWNLCNERRGDVVQVDGNGLVVIRGYSPHLRRAVLACGPAGLTAASVMAAAADPYRRSVAVVRDERGRVL